MKREFKWYRALQILLIVLAILGIVCIYPGNVFKHIITSKTEATSYQETGIAADGINIMQQFTPTQEYLHSITVMVDSLGGATGLFKLHLYDQNLNLLWEDGRRFEDSPGIADYTFHVEQNLVVGQPYYYTLDYDCASFVACYTERTEKMQNDNGILYYNLQEIPNGTLLSSYQYEVPFGVKRILAYDAILLFVAFSGSFLLEVLGRKEKMNKKITRSGILHLFGGSMVVLADAYAVWQIYVNQMFCANTMDNLLLSVGTILAGAVVFYAIMRLHIEQMSVSIETVKKFVPKCLQVVFWGMAILACCDFVNAGSNYAQGLAIRQMCIFFGLAVITMFQGKELWNIYNAIYMVLAVVGVFWYSKMFWGQGELFHTAIRTAIMCAIAGMILLSTFYNLIHKKIASFSIPFAILVAVFFVLLIVFRNNNIWEIAIVVPFGLFYIRQCSMQKMDEILGNMANGIIFAFVITTMQALLHRPFHYYTMVRYSGIFMTVTVTAVYLSMVFAVALCKLITKYQKSHRLQNIWKELLVMGLACGYEFLTLSRTGMVSCAVVYIVTCGLFVIFHWKQSFHPIRFLIISALTIICCTPIAYTASRIIPALVNRPTIYLGEEFQDSIKQGEPIDSFRYITIEKLIGKSSERILGKTDLNFVTQSGKTVAEVLEEAKQQNAEALGANTENNADVMAENGVSVNEDKLTYIDEYGSEYTIDNPDYSNGRLDIYKKYLRNLNLTGHPTIGLPQEDGTIVVHAHNSFIQMAYDCGIITGVVFLFVYIILGLRSVWYYKKRKDTDKYAMLPVIIFAAFGISSMVEYVFRPTIPLGFVFLLMIAPLIIRLDRDEDKSSDKELEQK